MEPRRKRQLGIFVTFALCLCSTPLLADQLLLRCDSTKGAISFSVLIDPAKRLVLDIGFGSKIETERFSETIIAANDKEGTVTQKLLIDRITGQFELTWPPPNGADKGGDYQ